MEAKFGGPAHRTTGTRKIGPRQSRYCKPKGGSDDQREVALGGRICRRVICTPMVLARSDRGRLEDCDDGILPSLRRGIMEHSER